MQPSLHQKYSNLLMNVRDDHERLKSRTNGHDFVHALMVAQYAQLIAEDEETATLGWLAGLIHNTDHLFGKKDARKNIERYLRLAPNLSIRQKISITHAVRIHANLDRKDDSPIAVILKDADKLANLGALLLVRVGQFRHNLPLINLLYPNGNSPNSTYEKPETAIDNIWLIISRWEPKLRTKEARRIARPYFRFLRLFFRVMKKQLRECDLYPTQRPLLNFITKSNDV